MARKRRSGFGTIRDYYKMCEESDGFDVNDTGKLLCGGIIELDKSVKEDKEDVIHIAKYAVDQHNKTHNSDLRFVSLVKVTGQICMYYITFKARSRSLKKTRIYQAKVWIQIEGDPVVQIFRQKPKPAIPVPKGAFLCFMHDLRKIPQLSHLKSREQIARLASRAWKSIPEETKLRHYNSRNLDYFDDVARFVR